jgi:hypothetical protein
VEVIVTDHDVDGAVQLDRPGDNRRVNEVAMAKTAGVRAEAVTLQLDVGNHVERL